MLSEDKINKHQNFSTVVTERNGRLDTSHETEVPLLFRLETFSTSATQSNILSTLFRTLNIALVPCICLHVGVVFLNCLAVVSASALEFQLTSRWRFLFLRFAVGFSVVGFFNRLLVGVGCIFHNEMFQQLHVYIFNLLDLVQRISKCCFLQSFS